MLVPRQSNFHLVCRCTININICRSRAGAGLWKQPKSCPEPLLQTLQAWGSEDPLGGSTFRPKCGPETNVKQMIHLKLGCRTAIEQKVIITGQQREGEAGETREGDNDGGETGGSVNKDEKRRKEASNKNSKLEEETTGGDDVVASSWAEYLNTSALNSI